MDQPHEEVGGLVGEHVAVSAGHVDRESQDCADEDRADGDQCGDTGTRDEQLPSVVPDERLVEALLDLFEESGLCDVRGIRTFRCIGGVAQNDKVHRTCVVDVRERSGLVALLAYHDVHSDVELTGLDARSDGFERDFVEDRGVAVFHAEAADELDVEACEVAVADEAEGFVSAFDGNVDRAVFAGEREVLYAYVVCLGIEICDPVLVQAALVSQKSVLVAVVDELVHLTQEALLLVVVSDDVAGADVARNLPERIEFGVVGLVHAVADAFHEVGGDLARLEGEDHVGGHGVVLELGIGNAILDEFFIQNCSLDSDGKTVEVLDRLVFAVRGRRKERGAEDQKHKKNR